MVKNPPAPTGDVRGVDSIPGSERSPGEGNGNLLQYSCLENSMDKGAWWTSVHGVTKSRTQLSTAPQFERINSLVLSIRYGSTLSSMYFPGGSDGKAFAYNAGDPGSVPGSGRSGEGNGNLFQYSCLENPMDRGTW